MSKEYIESEYRKAERKRQTEKIFKNLGGGTYLTVNSKNHHVIRKTQRDDFLNDPIINLYEGIRENILEYFEKNKIKWWKVYNKDDFKQEKTYEVTPENMPSRHILSSQIACLNHLFPIRQDKENVLKIAKVIDPDFVDVLIIDTDDHLPAYIQFEAVSEIDHLNEVRPPNKKPPRGEFSTSIDALIYAIHKNGEKYIIPIEWKYTEEYEYSKTPDNKSKGNSGEKRLKSYSELINNSSFLKSYPSYMNTVYFYEPFYQLMRQTLWAEQMINHKSDEKIKADNFIHVHIVPDENKELLEQKYQVSGKDMKGTWVDNLKVKEKYKIITPMDLLRCLDVDKFGELIQYNINRYWSK
jgi:hypothetical protein